VAQAQAATEEIAMSQRHLSREPRLADPRLVRPSRESVDAEPEKRRSILPIVIAALVMVGLAAYLLNGRGGPTASGWQNLHPPVVPTHITPDGVPGRPGI
jgi:hypothetical protein